MSLEFVTDLDFPVVVRRVSADKVAEYIEATGDDRERWRTAAPPSYAGALLFAAAPRLLEHPDVAPYTAVLVHLDQTFRWHAPLTIGLSVELRGAVARVRSRAGAHFVTYLMDVVSDGSTLIESSSTFLLGEAPAGELPSERAEPPIRFRHEADAPEGYDAADGVPSLAKSASRHDLVRYAGASGDFNPIHFDHEAARGAGLAGIVCHGLLVTAWVIQLAGSAAPSTSPIREMTVRYREPVYPGERVVVDGEVGDVDEGTRRFDLTVTAGDRTAITGRALVVAG
jgi:acyl dehydratase